MKYKTIGAFKAVENIPYCKAATDLRVGMGVILDRVAKTASVPGGKEAAQGCHYIVTNINDKPNIFNSVDLGKVAQGEHVRADDLTTVANLEIEFGASEITTELASVNAKDKLVFGNDGKLEKSEDDAAGYKVYFEVIEKTAYMGSGVLAVIKVQ